jgi:orotidine-5'-phosphate decarboxylase
MVDPRIIVALDVADRAAALNLAKQLDPKLCRVKVGKELFVAGSPQTIGDLRDLGFDVFLDLKFHDIPNTVAAACRAAVKLGVWMLNVHASGGRDMLLAAREAVAAGASKLIAVTVLTSLTEAALREVGVPVGVDEQVQRLAKLTGECGLDGVVCSAREAAMLRASIAKPFVLVTPGIRLPAAASDDQVRVVTPQDALRAGADYLVIGRPITAAKDPRAALEDIYSMINLEIKT